MDNVITEKRGLLILLVIATVLVFIGLVWVIATYLPKTLSGSSNPSSTVNSVLLEANCTHNISYWQKHTELYPTQIVVGGIVYNAKELKGILSGDTDDPTEQLQAQLTVAYLNISSGADQSYIEATIFDAYGWMVQHPAGSQILENELEAGKRLFNLLEAYNLGLTGVKPCEGSAILPATETSIAIESSEVISTRTPSLFATNLPSETFLPTNSPTRKPIFTVVVPSRTPIPTTSVPVYPTSTPSQTTAPVATNTPIQATEAPTSTRTATVAPTVPPANTPTPTFPPSATP